MTPALSTAAAPQAHTTPGLRTHAVPADSTPLPSERLLRGRRSIEINHNGEIYRLQSTRQGKLILTK